jgi:signal transduction histidine kinase
VEVTIQQSAESITVSVNDDGAGIASEHVAQVFSSFFHVQQKNSSFKGTGLGLAIAKGWVEAHGGEIHAESDGPGKGSRFWFTLPRS